MACKHSLSICVICGKEVNNQELKEKIRNRIKELEQENDNQKENIEWVSVERLIFANKIVIKELNSLVEGG